MSETPVHSEAPGPGTPGDDPWAAFGYLAAGVIFYGVIGWLISWWLHAVYWIPIGILVGAALGTYMVFNRYRFHGNGIDPVASGDPIPLNDSPLRDSPLNDGPLNNSRLNAPHNLGRTPRPASDDQGETS